MPENKDRKKIERFKEGVEYNSCTPRGLFENVLTAQEQCDLGEGVALGLLSLYPRYIQSIGRAPGGCTYDIVCHMVALNMIIGIQVKTTGNNKVRLTINHNTPGAYVAHRPDFSVMHAMFVVHADYIYYFIPMKEILKDPKIQEKLNDPKKPPVEFDITDYEKFKLKFEYMFHGPLPEILKYEDYWV